jgi:hypothetical protein
MRSRLIAVMVVGLLLVGGIAWAAIPDSSGVIHGCYKLSNGSVIVIDSEAGQTCPSGYAALNWNQTGPVGPPGLSGVHVLTATHPGNPPQPTGYVVHELRCPVGEVALSASQYGFRTDVADYVGITGAAEVPIVESNRPVGYQFVGTDSSDFPNVRHIFMTCAPTAT